jgi:hypothetical protein
MFSKNDPRATSLPTSHSRTAAVRRKTTTATKTTTTTTAAAVAAAVAAGHPTKSPRRKRRRPGANPTIASYNASVLNFYNATGSLARFENKNI